MSSFDFVDLQEIADREFDAHQKEIEDAYQQGRADAIDEVVHYLYEAEMNNLELTEFCFGLSQARTIANSCRLDKGAKS